MAKRVDSQELAAFVASRGAYMRRRRLAPRMLEVYVLCFHEGLSLTECAERLGIGYETTRVYLRRLRAQARRARQPLLAA